MPSFGRNPDMAKVRRARAEIEARLVDKGLVRGTLKFSSVFERHWKKVQWQL